MCSPPAVRVRLPGQTIAPYAALPGLFPLKLGPVSQSGPGRFSERYPMDENMKTVVDHHRSIVKMHSHNPRNAEPNSVIIALLGDLVDQKHKTAKKAAKKPR